MASASQQSKKPLTDSWKEDLFLVEQALEQLLPEQPQAPHAMLFTAARYSLLSSAKRLRPLIVLATARAFGISPSRALQPACALEMIHTYSLIHDDLPAMDNDDLRRGRPTLHKVYPEGHAILTGDYLLTYAFELIGTSPDLSAQQRILLLSSLAKGAGAEGMIGGQVVDLQLAHENASPSWEILRFMHLKKTAALLTTAFEFGPIIANANPQEIEILRNCGWSLGLAFQVVDDILDVTGKEEEMGKPVGSDEKNQKTTAVSILGLDRSRALADELLQKAIDCLRTLSQPVEPLISLAYRLVQRTT